MILYGSMLNFKSNNINRNSSNNSNKNNYENKTGDVNNQNLPSFPQDIDVLDENQKLYEQECKEMRNRFILGTLLALSSISVPIGGYLYINNQINKNSQLFEYENGYKSYSKEDSMIIENAEKVAKGGKYSNVIEPEEFMKLLDYSKLNAFSKQTKESIKNSSKYLFEPIDLNTPNVEDQILNMVKTAQNSINKTADALKENPILSSRQVIEDYEKRFITDDEILDNVDMSGLKKYQKDLTLVRALINITRDKIERNDPNFEKKRKDAIKSAQSMVDNIVKSYKTKAKVTGNFDGDDILSKSEMANLLDIKCLEGLPEEIKVGILSKVLESYVPINLRFASEEPQIEIYNKQIKNNRQKIQEDLNNWALKAQKEFWHLLHPNEVRSIELENK